MGKQFLISGASGFIGCELLKSLTPAVGNGNLIAESRGSHSDRETSETRQRRLEHPEYWAEAFDRVSSEQLIIFHLAAQTSAKTAAKHPDLEATKSWKISDALVRAIRDYKKVRPEIRVHVVFTSTATVYGRDPKLPVNELCATNICSDYDRHKIDFELALCDEANQTSFGLTILRLPNVYGSFVDRTSPDRGVLERWIKEAASGRPIVSYGGGNFLRDYLHVTDLCDLMKKVAESDVEASEIFNPGTGVGITIREAQETIVKEVSRRLGVRSAILHEPFPKSSLLIDQRNYVADVKKTNEYFSWQAKRNVKEEIARMVSKLQTSK